MPDTLSSFQFPPHEHVFLGKDHDRAERRTWVVIILCTTMMIAEIIGGALFGSLALMADGLHMSTHAGALLLAALAYTYARKYANDRRFSFGTGKFGDLAGYSSAIVLAMIALLIGYEAFARLLQPVAISFNEAIPIAVLGLAVNVVSAWLLSGGSQGTHSHGHPHDHAHAHDGHDQQEEHEHDHGHEHGHGHGAHHRDNNMRAAVVHVMADAAVSVLVIIGLVLARAFGWLWLDPVAAFIGAVVTANWAVRLLRDTGGILLDRTPDPLMADRVRGIIEAEGSPICICGGLGPGTSAPLSRSQPRAKASRRITGRDWPSLPICPMSRLRSNTPLQQAADAIRGFSAWACDTASHQHPIQHLPRFA